MDNPIGANHQPLIIAHRGASGLAPENTLAAFKLAAAMGATGVELDVQLSADGQPVVIHDPRVNRTTNARGAVGEFTAAQLQQLDAGSWFARQLAFKPRTRKTIEVTLNHYQHPFDFSVERVLTLEEVFRELASSSFTRLYVEIKGLAQTKKALLDKTLALVHQCRLEKSVTLLSFDHRIIGEAKRLAPQIRTATTFAMTVNRLPTQRSIIKAVKEANADEAALHFGLATRRIVEALQQNGIAVSVWTANSKLVMRRLVSRGVDAIMTNFPNRLFEVLESLGKLNNQ
jgi:glycerophosphoryl diester phosphodiesterase